MTDPDPNPDADSNDDRATDSPDAAGEIELDVDRSGAPSGVDSRPDRDRVDGARSDRDRSGGEPSDRTRDSFEPVSDRTRDRFDPVSDRFDADRRVEADAVGENAGASGGSVESAEGRLADELGRIDVSTTADGCVEGRVTGVRSIDERTVELTVRLPNDRTVSFDLAKPIPWSEEFLLARIVEDVGYDAASIDHLVGERIYLRRSDPDGSDRPGDAPASRPDSARASRSGRDRDDWLARSVRSATATAFSSLAAAVAPADRAPRWRLVDPVEREDADSGAELSEERATAIATALVAIGVFAAALGGGFAIAGGPVLTAATIASALPGLAIALIGLSVLFWRD